MKTGLEKMIDILRWKEGQVKIDKMVPEKCVLESCILMAQFLLKEEQEAGLGYSMDKPCPHCGGDPKIANPTGKCSHIYYPEAVNKSLKRGQ